MGAPGMMSRDLVSPGVAQAGLFIQEQPPAVPQPSLDIPPAAAVFGFSANTTGGHMARSMMLDELKALAGSVPLDAPAAAYRSAVLAENALGKATFASRRKSHKHLAQLYGLDPRLALFRVLRQLVGEDPESLPLTGLVFAFSRDEQLRQTFSLLGQLRVGEVLERSRTEEHLESCFPGRFSRAMKASLARNVRTTWTVTGHLQGHRTKARSLPEPRMAASVYAMFAGYLLGLRGEVLIQSVFSTLVTPDPALIAGHLSSGAARGWLRFRHAGGVMEIDFSPLLTEEELRLLHGTH